VCFHPLSESVNRLFRRYRTATNSAQAPDDKEINFKVESHLFTGSLAGIGKLPALAGWYIWYGMYVIFVL
jgi:hypothetical protein